MKRIYRVEYDVKYKGLDEFTETVDVLANGDARRAVEKAESKTEDPYIDSGDEDGSKPTKHKLIGWRLNSVTVLAGADIV